METSETSSLVLNRTWHDQALDAGVEAVAEGYLKAGLVLLHEVRQDPELRCQRVGALADAAVGRGKQIFSMAVEAENNPDLWLWLGATTIVEAWTIRGDKTADTVGEDRFRLFFATLEDAYQPLMASAQLLPEDPAPWQQLQTFAMGMQLDRDAKDKIWEQVNGRAPMLFPAHWARIQSLCAKWGGSHDEMFEFVRELVAQAPPGDPIVAMLPLAHIEYELEESNGLTMFELRKNGQVSEIDKSWVEWRSQYYDWAMGEIKEAGEKWVNSAGRHPRDLEAHHLFGAAYAQSSDPEALSRARWHLAHVGNRLHSVPWQYWGAPQEHYAEALRKLSLL